jgi:PPK2 family polyphosphate:nucleotide phosphotransferase
MPYNNEFAVKPESKVDFRKIDPSYCGKQETQQKAKGEIQQNLQRLRKAQYLLYANAQRSLLVVLQGLDASGKDSTVRHLFSGVDPQGIAVASFKRPNPVELAHDFLWRVHQKAPAKGQLAIFNRSHYEDVLVVRVHNLVPREVWSKRYALIASFEKLLSENGTQILKFYLHISPEEQLKRFKQRLDDPAKQWKIDESDYVEREHWPDYMAAYEDALSRTSTKQSPWYIIPSDHKWFRNLAISGIVADAIEAMKLTLPPAHVDIQAIRRKYHGEEPPRYS